jgi:hypothetical protein
MEAEFIALDLAVGQAEWLRNFVRIFLDGLNLCQPLLYIAIASPRLDELEM